MEAYMIWFWLGLFVVALFVEIFTSDMISIWFALAAIPSFILALANVPIVVQAITFGVIALVLLIFTRPVVKKYMKTNEIKTNVDAVIGQTVVCTKDITSNTIGRVKVGYQDWSAISKDAISIGEFARVLDVEGVKLIVEKIEK